MEEIIIIERRLVLVEETRIRQVATSEDVSVPVTLRKQTATEYYDGLRRSEHCTVTLEHITAFFDDRSEAESAIEKLADAGVPRAVIQMIADRNSETATASHESKSFWAMLGEFFLADDDRNVYAKGIRRGAIS